VSWLLVAFIPGLLMLATFGLSRLEVGLAEDTVSADDVTELLEQAKVESVRRPVPVLEAGPPGTLPHREIRYPDYATASTGAGLPTRVYVHAASNPQFRPTRQADRV
jgi:hypothetical protein